MTTRHLVNARSLFGLALIGAGVLGANGCGLPTNSDLGKACGPDVECADPLVCNDGTCAPEGWDLSGSDAGAPDTDGGA